MFNNLAAIVFLLTIYPESALITTSAGHFILHYVLKDKFNIPTVVKKKVIYLRKRYSNLAHERNNQRCTILHIAVALS